MNDTTNILEFPCSSCINRNRFPAGSSRRRAPHPSLDGISEARSARKANAEQKVSQGIIRPPSADYYSLTDRVEYFLFSIMSGAALVSLLLWILSLPSFEPAKSAPSAAPPLPRAESVLVTQNRG